MSFFDILGGVTIRIRLRNLPLMTLRVHTQQLCWPQPMTRAKRETDSDVVTSLPNGKRGLQVISKHEPIRALDSVNVLCCHWIVRLASFSAANHCEIYCD